MSDPTDANAPLDDKRDDKHHADGDAGKDAGETYDVGSLGAQSVPDASDATQPPEDEVEGSVPPGYDWPTHGGYLGCLVGTIAACLVTGFVGANLVSYLYIAMRWPLPIFALLTFALFVAAFVGFGRLGWRLGRRFYRYYPQPKPTWGEDDAAAAELAHIRPQRQGASGQRMEVDEPGSATAQGASAGDVVPTAQSGTAGMPGDRAQQREALVEGRQRQDDGGDGSGEAADQAQDADQQPQRP